MGFIGLIMLVIIYINGRICDVGNGDPDYQMGLQNIIKF